MAPTLFAPEAARAPNRDPSMLHVLVVDDAPDAAETLALMLELWGHQPSVALSGEGALRAAALEWPDVVVLDIQLPDMSGLEVARRLAGGPRAKRPFTIALTGHAGEECARRSREAGIDLHLVKPADPDELRAILSRFARLLA